MANIDIIAVIVTAVFLIGMYLWVSLAVAAVLGKAGRETWPAWVPIYNLMTLFQLVGQSPYLGLLGLIVPLQGFVWLFLGLKLSPRFGLSPAWSVLAFVSPPIWLSVIGWGTARWLGEEAPATAIGYATTAPPTAQDLFGSLVNAPAAGYDANGYPLSPTGAVDTPVPNPH